MLPIREEEDFVTINFSCSEASSKNLWQAGLGAKQSLQDLFSPGPQKRTNIWRVESQGKGNSNGT